MSEMVKKKEKIKKSKNLINFFFKFSFLKMKVLDDIRNKLCINSKNLNGYKLKKLDIIFLCGFFFQVES